MEGIVPAEVLDRPKASFQMPVGYWLERELKPMAQELLLGETARKRG